MESTGGHPAWLTPLLAYYAVLGVIMLLEWGRDEIARGVLAQLGVSLGVAGLLQGAILLISILRGRRRTGREGGGGCGVEDEGVSDQSSFATNMYRIFISYHLPIIIFGSFTY